MHFKPITLAHQVHLSGKQTDLNPQGHVKKQEGSTSTTCQAAGPSPVSCPASRAQCRRRSTKGQLLLLPQKWSMLHPQRPSIKNQLALRSLSKADSQISQSRQTLQKTLHHCQALPVPRRVRGPGSAKLAESLRKARQRRPGSWGGFSPLCIWRTRAASQGTI